MKIGIIGLGLIGGSMAIDLKKRGFASHIIGYDSNQIHAQSAFKIGFIDEIQNLENTISQSELIVVAIPADATIKILPWILDELFKVHG